MNHVRLNELVVTGLTGETKLKNSTSPISFVTARDLKASSAPNLIDAVAHLPGVSQITTGSGISKPIIRGLGYNRIVVVADGVRQEGQQWGDEHGIEIDAHNVGSVEVIKGPTSLLYGSDAMAGVLIMHSNPIPAEGEVRGQVSTAYQSNSGLWDYSLNGAGNQHGFVWDARYSGKMAHAYRAPHDGYVPGTQFHEQAGRLMLGHHSQSVTTHLTLSALHLTPSIAEGERDATTGQLEWSTPHHTSYSKTLPFQRVKHYKAVLDNTWQLGLGSLKTTVGYQQNRRQEYEESAHEYGLYFKLHTLTYDIRYLTDNLPGDWKVTAGLGGMWQRSCNEGEEFLIPAYRLNDVGLYAAVSKLMGNVTVNGGLRFDHRRLHSEALMDDGDMRFNDFARNFNAVTAGLGAVWNVSPTTNIRLNVARGFRAPNVSELASNGVHEGTVRYELGNQQLKAEYSLQADLGVDFSSKFISAQLALFANRINHYVFAARIPLVMEEGYLTYQYRQGEARLIGFEAGVDLHPVTNVHFENTLSMVNAVQLHQPRDTKYLPFTPAPRWNSTLRYDIAHKIASLKETYVSVGVECNFAQHHYYRADATETSTPAYALLNLACGTGIHHGKRKVAEVYLVADNLLNKAYQSHLSRLKYTDVNVVTGHQGIYNPGRNITCRLIIPLYP
ncbi:MAG: TonB-dependent receptor [Muribaculaceae bacterium]|nr:TonB-dependent receptor [Muribaculaceae bacterium]